ncbi:MAG: hypothetical protein ACK5TC_00285 [bacterium]
MSQTDGRKGEFATHHLLSFVTNCEGNMVSIHMNLDGLTYLIEKLEGLKKLVEDGHCEDAHLFSSDSIGNELSSTKLESVQEERNVVQHVKLYGWTDAWACAHGLIPKKAAYHARRLER